MSLEEEWDLNTKLILSGEIGCGKYTLSRQAVGEKIKLAGGFLTQRKYDGDSLVGFSMVPPTETGCEGKCFLSFENDIATRHDEVFSDYGARLLREAQSHPFAVIDEFGGFELDIPEFCSALYELLASPLPCIGVVKALPSAKILTDMLNLGNEYYRALSGLFSHLQMSPDVKLLVISGRDDAYAQRVINKWVDEFVGEI